MTIKADIECILEHLAADENTTGNQIITGFNYFPERTLIKDDITLRLINIHSHDEYKAALIQYITNVRGKSAPVYEREKQGRFSWSADWNIRNEDGTIKQKLSIKDIKTGHFIDLSKIPYEKLSDAGYNYDMHLVAHDEGFEISTTFSDEYELIDLAPDLLKRASRILFDKHGIPIPEDNAARKKRGAFPAAWDVPVVIVGGDITNITPIIEDFTKAYLVIFEDNIVGEYSFIINKNFAALEASKEYTKLEKQGFIRKDCLANRFFLEDYVDI